MDKVEGFCDQLRELANRLENGDIPDAKWVMLQQLKEVDKEESSSLYYHRTGDRIFVIAVGPNAEKNIERIKTATAIS